MQPALGNNDRWVNCDCGEKSQKKNKSHTHRDRLMQRRAYRSSSVALVQCRTGASVQSRKVHHAFLLVGHHAPQCCLEQKNTATHATPCTYCNVHILHCTVHAHTTDVLSALVTLVQCKQDPNKPALHFVGSKWKHNHLIHQKKACPQ